MSRAKELLEQATPLPWDIGDPPWDADDRLIVYAVNRLPDYEAAVEALDDVFTRLDDHFGEDGPDWLYQWADNARAALARLRDEVPA